MITGYPRKEEKKKAPYSHEYDLDRPRYTAPLPQKKKGNGFFKKLYTGIAQDLPVRIADSLVKTKRYK